MNSVMKAKNFFRVPAAAILLLLLTPAVQAQPGSLDPSFNGTGYAVRTIVNNYNYATAICSTPGGKILSGGYLVDTSQHPSNQRLMILRYNANGSLDNEFGNNGMVTTDFYLQALDFALQADGKILVAGSGKTGTQTKACFTLFRLNPDGSFDPGFGQGGMVQDTMGNWSGAINVLPDGKILAAGVGYTTGSPSFPYFLLARHHADGTPDTTFGNAGFITTQIWKCTGAFLLGMVLQPDGKILLGDEVKIGNRYCLAMLRYEPDGLLDPEFGTGGLIIDSVGLRNGCYKLAVQPDGKILVPAYIYPSDLIHPRYSLCRYNANGSRDTTFFGSGYKMEEEGAAYDIIIQPDGKILTCGNRRDDTTVKRGIVKRYLPSGEADADFGTGGMAELDMEKPGGMVKMAICPDGKIAATGYCNESTTPYWRNTLTVRLTSFGAGVPEYSNGRQLIVSPNPFTQLISVETPGLTGSMLELISLTGQKMASLKMTGEKAQFDLGFLPAGSYILKTCHGDTIISVPVMKIR